MELFSDWHSITPVTPSELDALFVEIFLPGRF